MDKRGGGGYQDFRSQNFHSQCRKLSQLNPFVLCFRKLPVSKRIMDKSGVSRFPVGKTLSYGAGKFRRVTLLRCVPENFR